MQAAVLSVSFEPAAQHVIIGRGRLVKQTPGNIRFAKMIEAIAPAYSNAPSKSDKGLVLSQFVDQIYAQAPDAGFVKKDPITGRWTTVEEGLARATAAQALRNYLNGEYRSSKQFKQMRRMQHIRAEQKQQLGKQQDNSASLDGAALRMNKLAAVTTMPRCVSPVATAGVDDQETHSDAHTFAVLFAAFGNTISTGDPFAPTPMAPRVVPTKKPTIRATQSPIVTSVTPQKTMRRLNSITPTSSSNNLTKLFIKGQSVAV